MKELAKISSWKYSKFLSNKRYNFSRKQVLKHLSKQFIDKAYNKISKWKGYSPTPLIKLKNQEIDNFNKDEVFDKRKPVSSWEKNNTLDC